MENKKRFNDNLLVRIFWNTEKKNDEIANLCDFIPANPEEEKIKKTLLDCQKKAFEDGLKIYKTSHSRFIKELERIKVSANKADTFISYHLI